MKGPFCLTNADTLHRVYVYGDAWECSYPLRGIGYDAYDFWRLYRSGGLFHRRLMWEDARGEEKSLSFVGVVYHLAEAVDALVRLYTSLGIPSDEDVIARFRVTHTKDRVLRSFDPDRSLWGEYVARTQVVEVEHRAALAEWRAGLRDHAVGMTKDVFAQFNWIDASPQVLRDIVDKLLDHRL